MQPTIQTIVTDTWSLKCLRDLSIAKVIFCVTCCGQTVDHVAAVLRRGHDGSKEQGVKLEKAIKEVKIIEVSTEFQETPCHFFLHKHSGKLYFIILAKIVWHFGRANSSLSIFPSKPLFNTFLLTSSWGAGGLTSFVGLRLSAVVVAVSVFFLFLFKAGLLKWHTIWKS